MTCPLSGLVHVMPFVFVMYRPLNPPTYQAASFVGSTAISETQASFIGRTTFPQLKPLAECGASVTTGMLNGQVWAWAMPAKKRKRSVRRVFMAPGRWVRRAGRAVRWITPQPR